MIRTVQHDVRGGDALCRGSGSPDGRATENDLFRKPSQILADHLIAAARESQRWQEHCHSLLASNEFLVRI